MEPIMKVCVIVPDDYTGTVIGDLSSRRGQIQGQETRTGAVQIDALVPLSEMFGFSTILRSSTQGKAEFTMEFLKYGRVPNNVADELIKKHQEEKKAGNN